MEKDSGFELDSKFLSALPVVNHFLNRLKFTTLLQRYLPAPDLRARVPPALALEVLLRNVILSRMPLYAVAEWAQQMEPELLGLNEKSVKLMGDDRIGRALDRLFDADRTAMLTDFVLHMIRTFNIDLKQLHNDSTSITLHGEYAEADGRRVRGKKTVVITEGFNKDHRPDLKQLLWILTVSSDGAIPVHFKVADGNTEDSTTHIETWKILRSLVGSPHFMYVADSKLCTHDSLHFIDRESGWFVTVLPQTRKEDKLFKDWIQTHAPDWDEIGRKPHPRLQNGPEDVIRAIESPIPEADGYRLLWFHCSLKRERDAQYRQKCINAAWKQLDALAEKLQGPRCRYSTKAGIAKKADSILEESGAARWLAYEIEQWQDQKYRQEKRGRPGSKTRWRRYVKTRFRIIWKPIEATIAYDQRTDGIFPLVTNRKDLTPWQIYCVYKSKQPLVEKRHDLLKNVLAATPAFLKSVSRLEAFLFLFFISLTVHALIERELRNAMRKGEIRSLPIYPEQRECKAPTAARVFDVFSNLQRHLLRKKLQIVQVFLPELSSVQKRILSLLRISPGTYGRAGQNNVKTR